MNAPYHPTGNAVAILSQDSALSAAARAAGWRVVARDSEAAAIVVLDARDALADRLAMAASLGERARDKGGVLMVLVGGDDVATLDHFYDAGATHFLCSPFSDAEFVHALRFAGRQFERLGQAAAPNVVGDQLDSISARDWLEVRRARGEQVSVIRIALSRFDLVNSGYGRAAGDALIRAAARRIAALIGEHHVLVRLKGPEFLVAIPDGAAEAIASTVSAAFARPLAIDGALVSVGARVGAATARSGESVDALLRRANDALDDARASDSVTVRFADQPTNANTLSIDLRRAIDSGEISVLFQPQVATATGRIAGVEALARWEHPAFGPIGADQLFAAADRADLGLALSDHIQRLALEAAAAWPAPLAGLRLSINLTAADIVRPGFADTFLDRVDAAGFARERLTVEITEGGLIDDLGIAAQLLETLRHAGCRVAIDDFGTGYSSLAYLKALPLDYLKIDKKLAQDITGGPRDRVVVRGVIDMARSLGLTVIAEGVETEEQLDLLAQEGCQYYQGFLRAGPLTSEELAALIAG